MQIHKFIKLSVCLLFIIRIRLIIGGIIKPEESNFSVLSNTLIQILKFCNNDYETIGINNNANKGIMRSLRDIERVIIILNNTSITDQKLFHKNKIDAFIVTVDESIDNLDRILRECRKFPSWNTLIPFFVVSGLENGCSDALVALGVVWKMNILNCYFFCLDSKKKPIIYTFNPHSKRAPKQWNIFREVIDSSNYMAIYSRPYSQENICKNLNFDRTKHLDKVTINMIFCIPDSKTELMHTVEDQSKLYEFDEIDLFIINSLKKALKVSVKFSYDLAADDNTITKPHGIFNHLLNQTSDLAMCAKTYFTVHNLTYSYPFIFSGFSILSQNRELLSPLEKIYNYYGILMISATIIVSMMVYFVIWLVTKPRNHSIAVFDTLRLWTSATLRTKIKTPTMRIFFSVIFLYFLILQATFQGRLAHFLTKPVLRDNAESLSDLQSSFYRKIFTTNSTKDIVGDYNYLKSKTKVTSISKCVEAVLRDKKSVCLEDEGLLLYAIAYENFPEAEIKKQHYYVSKQFIETNQIIMAVRNDWAIKERFNVFLMILEQSGLFYRISESLIRRLQKEFLIVEPEFVWKPIDMESITFIFYLWIIGMVCATYCFFLERQRGPNDKIRKRKDRLKMKRNRRWNRKVD